jgi:hypothetical protein
MAETAITRLIAAELWNLRLSARALREQATRCEDRAAVGRTLGQVECDLILDTLRHCLGNRTHAANMLSISIRTLRNRLHEYARVGLEIPPFGKSVGRESGSESQPARHSVRRRRLGDYRQAAGAADPKMKRPPGPLGQSG